MGQGTRDGDFPHLFNTMANQAYVGSYPVILYYGVDNLREEDHKEIIT